MIKCKLERYEKGQTKPPFNTYQIGEFEINERDDTSEVNIVLASKCRDMGFSFRSYTLSLDKNYKYEVLVI